MAQSCQFAEQVTFELLVDDLITQKLLVQQIDMVEPKLTKSWDTDCKSTPKEERLNYY